MFYKVATRVSENALFITQPAGDQEVKCVAAVLLTPQCEAENCTATTPSTGNDCSIVLLNRAETVFPLYCSAFTEPCCKKSLEVSQALKLSFLPVGVT